MDNIIFEVAIIFAGSALLASLFLFLKQPIILAYIALGVIIGPWGLGIFKNAEHIEKVSHLGIILLMYLLGLHLHPQKLAQLLKRTTLITLGTSAIFAPLFFLIPYFFGFSLTDSIIVGLALIFSSTVISLKLIPTTTLHQKHLGDVMISVLLLQDIIAIILLLFLFASQQTEFIRVGFWLVLKTILLAGAGWAIVHGILLRLLKKFDIIQDYIFLLSLGWCLLYAELAHLLGMSYEIGAFIAGVSLGAHPIALLIAEGLKPVREFFLILFFFSIGAQFDFLATQHILIPGLILAVLIILIKPVILGLAFKWSKESNEHSIELGIRLGQASEFSILVAYSALMAGKISANASYMIQFATIASFIISTYIVVYKYPSPIAVRNNLRQD